MPTSTAASRTILALLLAYVAVYFVVLGAIINAQYLADQRSRLLARSVDPVIPAQGRRCPASALHHDRRSHRRIQSPHDQMGVRDRTCAGARRSRFLNNWGLDGWELIQIVPGPNPENVVAYFKRPLS